MQEATERFLSFLTSERARHSRRLRLALLLAALIAVLLYQTQWFILRPALAILLVGQTGAVLALLWKNRAITKDLDRWKTAPFEEVTVLDWFAAEERFVKRLSLFESGCQLMGFAALGFEFWMATRSLWLAVAIGFFYPVSSYFGVTRRRNRDVIKKLRSEKQQVALSGLRRWDPSPD